MTWNINNAYKDLIDPEELLKHIDDFEKWLLMAENKKDLESALEVFSKAELYEHCAIIRDTIKKAFPD